MNENSSSEWVTDLQPISKPTFENLNNEIQNLREKIRTTPNSQCKQWAYLKLGACYFEFSELSRQQPDEPNKHNEYLEQAIEDYTEAYKIDSDVSSYRPITYFAYQINCIFQGENRARSFKIFHDLLRNIRDVKQTLFKKPDSSGNSEVIHYTSQEACSALVLDKKPFRFYNTEGMNDSNEGKAFFEVMEQLGLDFPDLESIFRGGNDNLSPAYAASFIKPIDDADAQYMKKNYGRVRMNFKHGTAFSSIVPEFLDLPTLRVLYENKLPRCPETRPPLYKIFYVDDDRNPTEDFHVLKQILGELAKNLRCFRRFYEEFSVNSDIRQTLTGLVRELLDGIRFLFKSGKWKEDNEVRALWMRYDQNSDDIKTDCEKDRKYVDASRELSCTEVGLVMEWKIPMNMQNS